MVFTYLLLFVGIVCFSQPSSDDYVELESNLEGTIVSFGEPGFIKNDSMTFFAFNSPFINSSYIIYVENDDDVVESVKFFKEYASTVEFRIRSGSNSLGGYSKCDECVCLDLSRLQGIGHIIGSDNKPYLGVQPGVYIEQFVEWMNSTDNIYNLMIPHGDCPMVHFGGYTHGGGESNIISQFGWTAEYLLGVRIVLADGELYDVFYSQEIRDILTNGSLTFDDITSKIDPDLIYALRGGGGGNFGVVTKFYFEPLPLVEQLVYASATYNINDENDILNHLNYYNSFIEDSFTSGEIHIFRSTFYIMPQVFPAQNVTAHLFPYLYGIEYEFYYFDPHEYNLNQTQMLLDGHDFINSFFDDLESMYPYKPVNHSSTQRNIMDISWIDLHAKIMFPFWLQTGYPKNALPTWITSRLTLTNSIDEIILQDITNYFWNDVILDNVIENEQIAPFVFWSGLAAKESDKNISLSNRYAQGYIYYVPLALDILNPNPYHNALFNKGKEFLNKILNNVSTMTYTSYMDSFSTELSDYFEAEKLETLKIIKCNNDQRNIFNYEVGITCDDIISTTESIDIIISTEADGSTDKTNRITLNTFIYIFIYVLYLCL